MYDSGCGDGETERQRILLFFGGISDDDFGYKTFSGTWSGREQLKQLQKEYGSEIDILAGSGVNENNVTELMTYTGVHQVHSSCRVWKKDITTSNEYVDFSYAGIQEKNQYEAVDAAKVHRLAELC